MANVLVVANRTAQSEQLLAAMRERSERGPCKFILLVPATPHGVSWAADMHSGSDEAESHMSRAVGRMREAGFDVEGRVGDPDASAAVQDALNFADFDEVIVSTLPKHLSKWLKMDLPRRVERITGLPVTHVEASEVKSAT